MGALVGLLGLLGFSVAVVMLVIKAVFKKGLAYKKIGALAGIALVLFIVGMVTTPSTKENFGAGREAGRQAATEQSAKEESEADRQTAQGKQGQQAQRPQKEKDVEPQMVLIEDAGQRLMEITKGHRNFSDVVDIKVYQQEDELLGTKTWAEVNTTYAKDWDDNGWCEEKAKLVIIQAFTNNVIYLDEARVYNTDNLQIASMRNWLPKE